MELQDRLTELSDAGIGVAAISYDSPEVLADFAARRGITFLLLADTGSTVITEFGILNTVAAEGLGPKRDDPAVQADVAKFVSVFGTIQLIVGTPYPGTFMLDSNNRVTSRFFEEYYRERSTTSNVMLKLGIGMSPVAAIQGTTDQLKFTAYPGNNSVTVGNRFSVAVDIEPYIEPNPGMHVYAPDAVANGYRVFGLQLAPNPLVRYEPVDFPDSEIYHCQPLDELVPVYMQHFTVIQEIVVDASEQAEGIIAGMETLNLSGTLEFQACDDAICYLPQSIPLTFTIDLENPDRQRAN